MDAPLVTEGRDVSDGRGVTEGRGISGRWRRFLIPRFDFRILAAMRIGYSVLLLVNLLVLVPDLERYFSEFGALNYEASRRVLDPDAWGLFDWLPHTVSVLWALYGLLIAATLSLLVGFRSRLSALIVFVLLTSLQYRNMLIFDAEDTVFRLFAAFFVLAHAGQSFSVDARLARGGSTGATVPIVSAPTWPIRLFQIQVSVIYLSSGMLKVTGSDWQTGSALYYVARLDDLFGQAPVPDFMFEWLPLVRVMSWGVVLTELALPFALWIERTRRPALGVAFLLHLSIEYAMHLFLFHWIMLVGLLSFSRVEDWRGLRRFLAREPTEQPPVPSPEPMPQR